jgi:hypothetical protein
MKKIFLLSSAMIIFFFILGVIAQPPEVDRKGPCKGDVEKFCKEVKGGKQVGKCLKENEAELSQACKDYIAAKREKRKEFVTACKADRQKFCKDIRHGKGKIATCLKSHENELSESCKAFFQKN